MTISATIITFNEEKNIKRCLDSLQGVADEIIIVDSFSTDLTTQIAAEYRCIIKQQSFLGYAEQKNLGNQYASSDYILSLDADECLSEELQQEILRTKKEKVKDAFQFNRLTNYAGHWVKHCGWYPDRKIRLFPKGMAYWAGPQLHETLILSAGTQVKQLKGDLLHYSFYSETDHLAQIEKFTNISAKDLFTQGVKSSIYKLYLKPVLRFFTDFIYKRGFLDGSTGFIICRNSAWAMHLKYKKLKQFWNENNTP